LSTDIEKAFLHVTLKETDRDFRFFLWLLNPLNPHSEFTVYRFQKVGFLAISSSFMLFAILHHNSQQHNTPLACNMLTNLYVDNIVSGCETKQQTTQFLQEARLLFSSAGFNLRAWTSNVSPSLRRHSIASNST